MKQLIDSLIDISVKAGQEILEVYSRDFSVDMKADDSPLTHADRRSHEAIVKGLGDIFVDGQTLPILSEEGDISEYGDRRNWGRYWLIDPLDGTKEFIKRNGEFTTNIALMAPVDSGQDSADRDDESSANTRHGVWEPVAGAVYVPVQDIIYIGWRDSDGNHAYQMNDLTSLNSGWQNSAIDLNAAGKGDVQQAGNPEDRTPLKVVASRSHLNAETEAFIDNLKERYPELELTSFGSSLKLCKVASGEADVYPRFAPTMEWDTAAADAVCRAAGLKVVQSESNEPLEYNKEDLLNPWFLVYRDPWILGE